MALHLKPKNALVPVPSVVVTGRLVRASGSTASNANTAMASWKEKNAWVHTEYDRAAEKIADRHFVATCAISQDDMLDE